MTPNLEHLEKLQALTKEYAQFSKQSSGLAYLAVIPLLVFANWLGDLLPLSYLGSFLGVVLTAFFISIWLFVRWQLVQHFYQIFGAVRVATLVHEKGFLTGLLLGGAFSIAFLVGLQLFTNVVRFPESFQFAVPIFVFAGIFAFQIYRNHGIPLAMSVFVFGAIIGGKINGNAANLTDLQRGMQPFTFALLILSLVSIGIREHQKFKRLEQKFKNLGSP
jgi:hypothetical protein